MARRQIPWLTLMPPIIFAGFVGIFFSGMLKDDQGSLPSAFIGRQAPALELVALGNKPAPSSEDLSAQTIKIVNFWASWCAPCRVEHPILMDLAAEGIPIIGINYKDTPENALEFLAELGDPYTAIGADEAGRNGFSWGVYGIPETFIVNGSGEIIYRFAGPVTQAVLDTKMRKYLDDAATVD